MSQEKAQLIAPIGITTFTGLTATGVITATSFAGNIVAISGTAFTDQHALQIKRFCEQVYLAYDGDSAGKSAAIRAGYVLIRAGLSPVVIQIPDGLDPDDWVKNQGPEPFLKAIKNGIKLLHFHYKNYNGNLSSASGKASFVNEVLVDSGTRHLNRSTENTFKKLENNNRPFLTLASISFNTFLNPLFFSSLDKKVIAFSKVKPALNMVESCLVKKTKVVRGVLFFNFSIERLNLSMKGAIKSKDVSLSVIFIIDKF